MNRWRKLFYFILAVLFLIEEWLWVECSKFARRLIGLFPFKRIKEILIERINTLPPWGCLIIFIVPVAIAEPIKFFGLYCIATGHLISGVTIYIISKLVGFIIIAFVFETCRDKLLQIGWFRSLYKWLNKWSDEFHLYLAPFKAKVHEAIDPIRQSLKAIVVQDGKSGFFTRIKRESKAISQHFQRKTTRQSDRF